MERAMMRWLVPLLLLPNLAVAAGRTPYGGEVVAYIWGASLSRAPANLQTFADATVQGALFEGLYAIDAQGRVVPELASALPTISGRRALIPLRAGVKLHDGRPLTASMIASALESLAAQDSTSKHIVLPIEGARDGGPLRIAPSAQGDALEVSLAVPYPELARLWASPRARIALGEVGTGPFRLGPEPRPNATVLLPFLGHRDGRPFLDRVELRQHASRFGAFSIFRKRKASLVFSVPDTRRRPKGLLRWGPHPKTLLILSIGRGLVDRSKDPAALRRAIDAVLNRRLLAQRYLGAGARPVRALAVKDLANPSDSGQAKREPLTAKLLISKDARELPGFAMTVQTKLIRAGVQATIEKRSAQYIAERRRTGDYELLIDSILPDEVSNAPIDQLHALMSIAAAYGRADAISDTALSRAADPSFDHKAIAELERSLRERLMLIPIADRPPSIAVRDDLRRAMPSTSGSLELQGAYQQPGSKK